jgi:PAS domain-containing protein
VCGFVSVGIEITNAQSDLLLLRKENIFLKSTIDALDDAIFVTDSEGKLNAFNRPFKRLVPNSASAIKKRNVMQLIESIAASIRDVDCETFRDDAGFALSTTGEVQPGEIASGSFLLWSESAKHWLPILWQARGRFSGGIFVGLLWIFQKKQLD